MAGIGAVAIHPLATYTSGMDSNSLVVIAIDGLRAAALGPYGNTTFPTPYFDRLASESVVYDQYLADSADVNLVTSSLWTGQHPLRPDASGGHPSLAARYRGGGIRCHLVTDEMPIAEHPGATDWDEIVVVESPAARPAEEVAETAMSTVLATALEVGLELNSRSEPSLLWVHLRGMQGPWDAPPQLAHSLRDEDDPQWEPCIEVPRLRESAGDDLAFAATCRYAGQVMALDQCLEGFVGELTSPRHPRAWDLVLLGVRGFPLGEHGWVGEPVPYGEQFHVPLCYRRADGAHRLTRYAGLVQPSDVHSWLTQFPQSREPLKPNRAFAISEARGKVAIASPEWRVVANVKGKEVPDIELYSSGDDRWQANNVASRCPDQTEEFCKLCQQLETLEGWESLLPALPLTG